MSRLTQALERLHKGTAAPMGFGLQRPAQKERPAAMLLLAAASKVDSLLPAAAVSDGVLLQPAGHAPSASVLKKLAEVAKDATWGVRSDQVTAEQVKSLKEQGCDFIVLASTEVLLEALQGEEMGRVLLLPKDLKEELGRTIEGAPVDFVMGADPASSPLTLQSLLDIAALRWMVNKPFLLPVSGAPTVWELECLRDMGVDGLVLLSDTAGAESLQTLHDRLRDVPPKRPAKNDRAVALLPQLPGSDPRRVVPEPDLPDEDDD